MKPSALSFCKTLTAAVLSLTCLFAAPLSADAKDKDKDKDKHPKWKHKDRDDDDHDRHRHYDHDRSRAIYLAPSRPSFSLSFGNGYAGRGYYYGPPNTSYYDRQPGVTYYRTRESYYGGPSYRSNSIDVAVQRSLARRGYYHGPIDGDIGPASRRAIARYQDDRGLRVTGSIDSSLLRSLDLD